MGYSNGQLETSSGTGRGEKGDPGLSGIGFNLTDDGNFDLDSKRLTDLADPVDDGDAATKKYVDDHIHSGAVSKKYVDDENARQDIAINSKAEKNAVALLRAKDNIFMNNFKIFNLPNPSGPQQPATKAYIDGKNTQQDIAINSKAERDEVLLLDGSKSMMDNLQMGKNKIVHLGDGSSPGDAVNYSQLIDHTRDHSRDDQLAPSPKFYRDFGDKGELTKSSLAINNHQHLDLYDVGSIEIRTTDFQGFASSNIKMTNNLERGIYTAVFELFSSRNNILNDETLLQNLTGDSHYKVLNYSHDWESDSGGNTPHSKAYIQFSTDGSPGEIKFEIQYYGSHYNQSGLDLLFYSRVLRGKHNDTFDHRLFDAKESDYLNHLLFFEDFNLNKNRITNLGGPVRDDDAVNKGYVDGKVVNVDLTGYLRRDGSLNMTGNLKMDKKYIDLETPNDVPITDLVNYRKDAYRAANKEYLRQNFLKKDENGGGDYDLKQNVIRNAEPYRDGLFGDNDLVSKAFVDAEIAKLPKNVLKLDGSLPMRGNLQMGDHTITGIRSSSQDNAALTVGGAKSTYLPLNGSRGMESSLNVGNNTIRNLKMPPNNPSSGNPPDDSALNFKYFHTQRGDLERQINEVGSKAFSKDGSDLMEGKLDMNIYDIINLPTADSNETSYAANVNYVNKTVNDSKNTISNLIDIKIKNAQAEAISYIYKENVFKKVMADNLFKEDDDRIKFISSINYSLLHRISQKTYLFTIDKDKDKDKDKTNSYNGRLSIDVRYLNTGIYTMVFEMIFSVQIDRYKVTVNAVSGTLNQVNTITKIINFDRGYYSRSIINFHKWVINPGIDDLDIDLHLELISGISPKPDKTQINVIVYGIRGSHIDVPTEIWDRLYYFDRPNIKFQAPINMNDNQIKNLQDGNENGDAVNVKQLNAAVKGVYFYTRNPVYSQTALNIIQTMKWNSISNYQWSSSNDFKLNSDSITIKQSGLYLFYYQKRIKGIDNDKQKGFICFSINDDRKNHSICTYKIGSDKLTTVSLNFYSYFTSGDKLKIYAYYVNQFGSGLKHDENLIIKKII